MEMVDLNEKAFAQYRRKQIAELRPWREGDDMAGISVSREDVRAGSPMPGDMIARNPKNHADQWLVAAAYFEDNFEPATALQSNESAERQVQKLTAENERLRKALTDLVDYVESNECHHEGVHRGGSIWTICDECGAKWADDKGGFQPYKEPPELTAARSALETQEGGK